MTSSRWWTGLNETRTMRKIRQAVEAKGYRLISLMWEPWGIAAEKEGIPGGWSGEVEPPWLRGAIPGNEIYGLSVEEVLELVASWPAADKERGAP